MFEFVSGDWRSGPVREAATFLDRWKGLRPRPGVCGLLIETRSVHSVGMSMPIWVVAIDAGGTALAVERLDPGRVFISRRARWILELPVGRTPPEIGARLERS